MSNSNLIFQEDLQSVQFLHVQQVYEGFELLGFEGRNKYQILDEQKNLVAYAAEENTGFGGMLSRQFFGHWRTFNINIFNHKRESILVAHFPFRWFFKSLYLDDAEGRPLGHLQQRFALFHKKFDLHDVRGRVVARIRSPLFKIWTFEIKHGFKNLGRIEKKWKGILSEMFTDTDQYIIRFGKDADLEMKQLMLATCLMIDIVYFENNQAATALDLLD